MSGAPFPGLPLDIMAEMYLNGDWRSVTPDVYERSPFNITRGVTDESTSSVASQCGFQLNNRAGNYDPSNPLGAYYNSIGRGTPFRLAVRTGIDEFGRTLSSGWGTADVGGAWATISQGGTISPSDYSVTSGVGKHSVPARGARRCTYLSSSNYFDVDVAVTCSVLPGVNVTGGPIEFANIVLRSDGNNWYHVRTSINPADQSVTIGFYVTNNAGASIIQIAPDILAVGPAGAIHHSGNPLRVRALVEGQVVRAKVWDTTGPEPQDWQLTSSYYSHAFLLYSGFVGIASEVDTANTNTLPVVVSYSDFQVRIPRYAGQIASIVPTASDISGKDPYSEITVAGALRRINGSTAQVQSALRRSIPSLPNLVSYWPMEDGAQSTSLATGLYFGAPMSINGSPSLASYSGFPSSAPIPTMAPAGTASVLTAEVPPYVPTNNWQVRCLIFAANPVAGSTIMRISTTGTVAYWDLIWASGGNLELKAYDSAGNVLLDLTTGFGLPNNYAARFSVQGTVSGSNTNFTFSVLPLGVGLNAGYSTGTVTGSVANSVTAVAINPLSQCGGWAFGHLTVESASTDLFALATQFNAYVGENAGDRVVRLCSENGIVGDQQGDADVAPALMGAQLVNTLPALLQECADADRGILYEPRGAYNALSYKALGAHYNRPVTLALSTATHDLGAYPRKTFDDQTIHNTVTVQRPSGSSVTVQVTTAPLGTNVLNIAGAQQVQANVQSDGQLNDLATWIVHMGTVSDPRYPPLPVNLLRPGNVGLMIPAASVDVDDKVTIAGLQADLTGLLARGYTEQLSGWTWTITFNFAPESPFEIFTLDDPVLGRLDSDFTLLGAAIGTGDTSFGINATDGTLWTTNSADWPVLIEMGGEVMSVGAISGTTALQTFSSVTRAVNGVSKSHAMSEAIHVAHPVYLALGRP